MRRAHLLFAALAALTGSAYALESPIALTAPAPLAAGVDAFPKLSAHDAIAGKINAALVKLDQRVRKARAECFTSKDADWSRSISVTLRGPRFLSYLVADSMSCGGPHPDASIFALVYDLKNGAPVDWAALLPKSLVERTSLATAADGAAIGVVASKTLTSLYVAGLGKDTDPDCKQALSETDLDFVVWPDAEAKGLDIQTVSLPHVVQACADVVTIGVEKLRELGVAPSLIEALGAK
ncbi:MAG: hypothetical protein JO107_02430 [Hyphomicrobiales bacterium]|nr:hypothetical protein [Hyphomicrobiales bacterium]MBV8661937.1 hypothetical protein [Hyphomicrobiales bacterium]